MLERRQNQRPKPTIDRLLIVDDDSVYINIVRDYICDVVRVIESVGTIKEGLAINAEKKFEVVILDIQLPDGMGIDFVEEFEKEGSFVVILTGYKQEYLDKVDKYNIIQKDDFCDGFKSYLGAIYELERLKRSL